MNTDWRPGMCRAMRWDGEPSYEGPHAGHLFTYGPLGMYTGSCAGIIMGAVDSPAMTTPIDELPELPQRMPLHDILWHCLRQNVHLDESNAAIHTAPVRYSPITFRLAEYLWNHFPSYRNRIELAAVAADLGSYDEDTGR